MSILKKPYELSLWVDVLGHGGYEEERRMTIGSDTMTAQCRAFEPELTTNVNGQKKLTFKLYKQYIDNVTGEKTDNPFYNELISEGKIKLKYDGEWYDFVIKNKKENSATHLCTYELEDANVLELSKNGFDIVLDEALRNNSGDICTLANRILDGSGWEVLEDKTEELWDKISEPLVDTALKDGTHVLAFYSSYYPAENQYLYQYIPFQEDYELDEDNHIINVEEKEATGDYPFKDGGTIFTDYKGYRLGKIHKSHYEPKLDRYVKEYKNGTNDYYGYEKVEYKSPTIVQNILSNYEFKSTSGWVGATTEKEGERATVETVYGYFDNNTFVDCTITIPEGATETPKTYLKLYFPAENSVVFNTGPRDRRYELKNMPVGQEYKFSCDALNSNGNETGDLTFSLGEWVYSTGDKCYNKKTGEITFSANETSDEFTVGSNTYTDNLFQKQSEVRLAITCEKKATYYIESIALYPKIAVGDDEKVITPAYMISPSDDISTKIERQYIYFSKEDLASATGEDDLKKIVKTAPDNDTYVPQYTKGEKWRNVSVKESNYFNNLQALAEAFEAWLVIDVQHNSDGKTGDKNVYFKENIGQKNYANFIYGVNLKDIQRTYESKELATKLIVKPNSNQYAPDGFCDISKAPGNVTGETAIYDFSYYFKTDLMSEVDYLDYAYGSGQYYDNLKKCNQQLIETGKTLTGLSTDLVTYQAELEAAEAVIESANSTIEELDYELKELSGSNTSLEREDVKKVLIELRTAKSERDAAKRKKATYAALVGSTKEKIAFLDGKREELVNKKKGLNQDFYQKYSRFIQEGTWIDEEYLDDNLYYFDAQSVLNESCYPQVQYSINVLELSQLAGYEHFNFRLADRTNVIDPEFFKTDKPFEVVITEKKENLDDPTKNTMKLQNFKNQFKDLFQKITATVQQAQYRAGSYEKAVALVEANKKMKYQFLADSLSAAGARLAAAGQQSVVMDERGLTITSVETPTDTIRMVGGAILISKQDENGQLQWTTAMTADGISASIITSGIVNTGEIAIMNKNQPTFRWDAFGLNAFGFNYITQGDIQTIGDVNYNKFVRFDRFGIYGVNEVTGISGLSWKPQDLPDIDEYATFALTWEGLKVTGGTEDTSVVARIGKQSDNIINVTQTVKGENDTLITKDIFRISNDGSLYVNGSGTFTGTIYASNGTFAGQIQASKGQVGGWHLNSGGLYSSLIEQTSKLTCDNDAKFKEYYNSDKVTGKGAVIVSNGLHFNATYNSYLTSKCKKTTGKDLLLTFRFTGHNFYQNQFNLFTINETPILFAGNSTYAKPTLGIGVLSFGDDPIYTRSQNTVQVQVRLTGKKLIATVSQIGNYDANGQTFERELDIKDDIDFEYTFGDTGKYAHTWRLTYLSIEDVSTDSSAIYLGTKGIEATIGGVKESNWVLKVGGNFGVTQEGKLYTNGGYFEGEVYATDGTFQGAILGRGGISATSFSCAPADSGYGEFFFNCTGEGDVYVRKGIYFGDYGTLGIIKFDPAISNVIQTITINLELLHSPPKSNALPYPTPETISLSGEVSGGSPIDFQIEVQFYVKLAGKEKWLPKPAQLAFKKGQNKAEYIEKGLDTSKQKYDAVGFTTDSHATEKEVKYQYSTSTNDVIVLDFPSNTKIKVDGVDKGTWGSYFS